MELARSIGFSERLRRYARRRRESHVYNKNQQRKRELHLEFNIQDQNQVYIKECVE